MRYSGYLLVSFLVPLTIGLLSFRTNSRRKNSVYLPPFFLVLALLCLSICILGLFIIFSEQTYEVLIGIAPVILIAVWGIWLWAHSRITFFEDCFYICKQRHKYDEITRIIIQSQGGYHIVLGRQKIECSSLHINARDFYKMLKKKQVLKNAEIVLKLPALFRTVTLYEDHWRFRGKEYRYEDITKVFFDERKRYIVLVGAKKIVFPPLSPITDEFAIFIRRKKHFKDAKKI